MKLRKCKKCHKRFTPPVSQEFCDQSDKFVKEHENSLKKIFTIADTCEKCLKESIEKASNSDADR